MDAEEEATASHGRRDRKRWNGEKESTCEADAWTKPCRLRRRETQGQSARTLSPGSGGRRAPRPLLRLASYTVDLRPTVRHASSRAHGTEQLSRDVPHTEYAARSRERMGVT
jgi:hypothetical protein